MDALDFTLKPFEDEFAVAIATFDKPFVGRDLQPDTRMAARATVTSDAVCRDDAGFWCVCCHVMAF